VAFSLLCNKRCAIGRRTRFVLFDEIFFAKNEVRLEEEQDLFSLTRFFAKNEVRLEELQHLVLFDEIVFAKNKLRLEESQDLVQFFFCGGSCHLSPKGEDPGYVSRKIEKNIQ
jgi:hypothetical protein